MDDRFRLGDPQLALQLMGTLRQDVDALVDELDDPEDARAWLADVDQGPLDDEATVELREFRDRLRNLFTTVTAGQSPPTPLLELVNEMAARDPLTLQARMSEDGSLRVDRTSTARNPIVAAQAEFARAALALLADETCSLLRLCDAPNCVRFFLKQRGRQQWCTPACGNRARVARHYARRHLR